MYAQFCDVVTGNVSLFGCYSPGMATQIHDLPDTTPVDIVAALSLAAGDYVLTVDGLREIRIFEGSAAPTSRKGHLVLPGRSWYFTAGDDPIWVWTPLDATTVVVSGT